MRADQVELDAWRVDWQKRSIRMPLANGILILPSILGDNAAVAFDEAFMSGAAIYGVVHQLATNDRNFWPGVRGDACDASNTT